MNLYHVTKFSPYFSFTVYCFYTKISSFMPVLSTRIVLDCFYLLIFYSEKFSTDVCRLPYAVNVNLNLSNQSFWKIQNMQKNAGYKPPLLEFSLSLNTASCMNIPTYLPSISFHHFHVSHLKCLYLFVEVLFAWSFFNHSIKNTGDDQHEQEVTGILKP